MKLTTEVICPKGSAPLGLDVPVCLLGSCFADEIGRKMSAAGFRVLANPFGTLYNPASIANAVSRLDHPVPFGEEDCVPLGAGDGRTGSFWHHTSFARSSAAEFLESANAALAEAAATWQECGTVILSLGTAYVWRALERPGHPVVANCLKRPAREFAHDLLSTDACAELLHGVIEAHPEKRFLLTVSPIRHLGDGAHANTVSKSTLHLAVEQVLAGGRSLPDGRPGLPDRAYPRTPAALKSLSNFCHTKVPGPRRSADADSDKFAEKPIFAPPSAGETPQIEYFPAYEILMDELRDYRFYAEDLVHPSQTAVEIIWERFLDAYGASADLPRIRENEKAARAAAHVRLQAGGKKIEKK